MYLIIRLQSTLLIARLIKSQRHRRSVKDRVSSSKVSQTRIKSLNQRTFQNNQNLSVTLKMRMMLIQMLKRRYLMLIERNLFKLENNSPLSPMLNMVMDFGQDSYFSSQQDFQTEKTNLGTLLLD